ncbi:hypothetical protein [Hyphomicrobium sp.]|uniref:hypothetical protein n=1 Tax=Hyphomicrobium sp. TaxID=82 RepID=UPI000FAC7556|nr:hypothetical protein [Hyphomicrobium sp.]RUP11004.1 MAG: hypothetical protein EKK38_00675 [Hyphomicrobium sp.]
MDRIERWIKRSLASAVAAGIGQWADSPESALGKRIYQVTDGPMTLVLSQLGFTYDGAPRSFECRYDEVEAVELTPLVEFMRLRGDLSKIVTTGIILRGVTERLELQLPLAVYSSVVTVLFRIVKESA